MKSRHAKKRAREDHHGDQNVERWMVSYADFITLLFAFFVVMYAISSVNEGKYKTLSDTLRNNFGKLVEQDQVSSSPLLIESTSVVGTDVLEVFEQHSVMEAAVQPQNNEPPVELPAEPPRPDVLNKLSEELRGMFGSLIEAGNVDLQRTARGLELEINSQLLFDSASSELNKQYLPLLAEVAAVLSGRENAVDVEGFTDNLPIYNERYPSNWELSAARAAAVSACWWIMVWPPVAWLRSGTGPIGRLPVMIRPPAVRRIGGWCW